MALRICTAVHFVRLTMDSAHCAALTVAVRAHVCTACGVRGAHDIGDVVKVILIPDADRRSCPPLAHDSCVYMCVAKLWLTTYPIPLDLGARGRLVRTQEPKISTRYLAGITSCLTICYAVHLCHISLCHDPRAELTGEGPVQHNSHT